MGAREFYTDTTYHAIDSGALRYVDVALRSTTSFPNIGMSKEAFDWGLESSEIDHA
jgi:hypothetical protein